MENQMFCYQCQETAHGTGCTLQGVCGKKAPTANMMDLLLFAVRGVCTAADALDREGVAVEPRCERFIIDALFSTITNANFDTEAIRQRVNDGFKLRDTLIAQAKARGITLPDVDELTWQNNTAEYDEKAKTVGVLRTKDVNLRSHMELCVYGMKGMAAYMEHAMRLGKDDESVHRFIRRTFALMADPHRDHDWVQTIMDTGTNGVKAMALLDAANTGAYGNPEITSVNIGVGTRPGILISGHDLRDMEQLLEQSEGQGVDIYTHSEMLPANYYPAFKKYKHFFGNYGGAWWSQRKDFETFNGPILFTTNCIVPPLPGAKYADRVFTTNSTGYPGWPHIMPDANGHKDFTPIIEMAKKCQPPTQIEEGHIIGGFAHAQVKALAPKVLEAIKSGAIKRFVLMGGCDGRFPVREYYTEFAEKLPQDTVILTAGCAKYRYIKLPLGDIGGIPRVLDAGQCNDSYSLVLIAKMLQEALGLETLNDLPVSYNIAWYEQKAVIVLLALLSLGVKNIHAGPTLPAFLSPDARQLMLNLLGLTTITTVDNDLKVLDCDK